MSDELRVDALGCYGNQDPRVATPGIDRLAREGVVFDRNYASSPVCVPARASLVTGLSPVTTGVLNNEAYFAPPHAALATWTESLAAAGWATSNFGKEHLPGGLTPWQVDDPAGSGMRETLDAARACGAEIRRSPGIGHVYAASLPLGAAFPGDAVTANAVGALERADQPFVIRASYLQPHKPMVVPEPWASRYADVDFPVDPEPSHAPNRFEARFGEINRGREMTAAELQASRRLYYGAVAWLDEQVRIMLDTLDRLGLTDSTVVVLTSDHGAHLGEFGAIGKHTFAPVSHQTPLIIRLPGRLPQGLRRSDLTVSEDLAPTVLGLCGLGGTAATDGRDLFDPGAAPRTHVTSVIGYGARSSRAFPNRDEGRWDPQTGWPQRVCIRTARYRYELNTRMNGQDVPAPERDVFLADRRTDEDERRNVADDPRYRDVRGQLAAIAAGAAERLSRFEEPPPLAPGEFAAVLTRFTEGDTQ